MKIPDCSREEGEVKHQNGGTKKVFLENKLSNSALIISSQQEKETVISPTSPILNHDNAEENCHEMVIIQSDKSTGIILKKSILSSSWVISQLLLTRLKFINLQ